MPERLPCDQHMDDPSAQCGACAAESTAGVWLEGYFPPDIDAADGWDAWQRAVSTASPSAGWVYFAGGEYTEEDARAALSEVMALALASAGHAEGEPLPRASIVCPDDD